jgi:hypothetical protein
VTTDSLLTRWKESKAPFTVLARTNPALFETDVGMLGLDPDTNDDGTSEVGLAGFKKDDSALVSILKFYVNGKGSSSGKQKFDQGIHCFQVIYELFRNPNTAIQLSETHFPDFASETHTFVTFERLVADLELNRYKSALAVVHRFKHQTPQAVTLFQTNVLESPCSADEADVILSTIHSAKGIEWDDVQLVSDVVVLKCQPVPYETKAETGIISKPFL